MIRISGLDVLVITILGIIQLCNTHILPRRSQACAAAPADILFLLDSSRSEGFYNFELQKNFVSKFVTFLNIGPNDAQVSVGTFSTHANSFFLLNSYHNQYSLLNAIARIPYLPGGTHTDYALYMAEHYTFTPKNGDRLTAPNIVYVLTDGESDSQYHTHIAAQHLKGTGAKVFAIGVGHVSMNELIAMATDHEHVFTVNSFTDLESIQHLVQATYCDVISGTLCIDKISSCYTYSKSVCLEPSFVAWAQMNCPDYCGFCQINTPIPPTIQIPTIPSAKSTTVLPATKATPLPSTTIKLTTSTIKTSTTKGSAPQRIPEGPCVDKITNCAAYGDSVCTTYRLWSIENCARFCVFCHDKNMTPTTQTSVKTTNAATSTSQRVYDVCEDKLAKCSTYGIDICVKYASWAAVQCPKFCRFCTPSTNITTTQTTQLSSTTTTFSSTSTSPSQQPTTIKTATTTMPRSTSTLTRHITTPTTSTLLPSASISTQYTTTILPSTTTAPSSTSLDTVTTPPSASLDTVTTPPSATQKPCLNTRKDCANLGLIICFTNQTYAEENCALFCNFCNSIALTDSLTTTPTITEVTGEQSPQTSPELNGFTSTLYSSTMTTNPKIIVIG